MAKRYRSKAELGAISTALERKAVMAEDGRLSPRVNATAANSEYFQPAGEAGLAALHRAVRRNMYRQLAEKMERDRLTRALAGPQRKKLPNNRRGPR